MSDTPSAQSSEENDSTNTFGAQNIQPLPGKDTHHMQNNGNVCDNFPQNLSIRSISSEQQNFKTGRLLKVIGRKCYRRSPYDHPDKTSSRKSEALRKSVVRKQHGKMCNIRLTRQCF